MKKDRIATPRLHEIFNIKYSTNILEIPIWKGFGSFFKSPGFQKRPIMARHYYISHGSRRLSKRENYLPWDLFPPFQLLSNSWIWNITKATYCFYAYNLIVLFKLYIQESVSMQHKLHKLAASSFTQHLLTDERKFPQIPWNPVPVKSKLFCTAIQYYR